MSLRPEAVVTLKLITNYQLQITKKMVEHRGFEPRPLPIEMEDGEHDSALTIVLVFHCASQLAIWEAWIGFVAYIRPDRSPLDVVKNSSACLVTGSKSLRARPGH